MGKMEVDFVPLKLNPVQTKSRIGILQYCHIKAFVSSDCPCFSFGLICFCFFRLMWDLHRDCGMSSSPASISAAVQLPKMLCFCRFKTHTHTLATTRRVLRWVTVEAEYSSRLTDALQAGRASNKCIEKKVG